MGKKNTAEYEQELLDLLDPPATVIDDADELAALLAKRRAESSEKSPIPPKTKPE